MKWDRIPPRADVVTLSLVSHKPLAAIRGWESGQEMFVCILLQRMSLETTMERRIPQLQVTETAKI